MNNSTAATHVCPVERAGMLDSWVRKLIHPVNKIVGEYVAPGSTVIDMGSGPGYFTIPMAELAGPGGRVIAVDMQQGMLDKIAAKIRGGALEERIRLHRCAEDSVGLDTPADFILAFYMVHEAPSAERLLRELGSLLKPGGNMLVVEPVFHVTKKKFREMLVLAEGVGLKAVAHPKGKGGRAVLFSAV